MAVSSPGGVSGTAQAQSLMARPSLANTPQATSTEPPLMSTQPALAASSAAARTTRRQGGRVSLRIMSIDASSALRRRQSAPPVSLLGVLGRVEGRGGEMQPLAAHAQQLAQDDLRRRGRRHRRHRAEDARQLTEEQDRQDDDQRVDVHGSADD